MDELDLGATIRGFTPGQKIFGRYTLDRILGRGGMGVVWLARDGKLDRDVALKFLPEVVASDPRAVDDLKRETRRSLELTHPHIVRIYDFIDDAQTAAIAMEYVPGSTLSKLALERPHRNFEPGEIVGWTEQLCDALDYAHRKAQIVHRDLKPANLMLDASGELKIADFGIAASVSDSVSRVSVQAGSSGTPVYMSPQQMMGEKPAVTDDVYALGATLYELLTGKPPFYSGNVLMQVQNKVPPSIAERRKELGVDGEPAPREWEEAIAACLAKEAGDRPQSAGEVAERLGLGELTTKYAKSAKNTEVAAPAAAKEVGRTGPGAPPSRSRAPVYVGLVAVVAALAFGGWWFGIHVPGRERQAEVARAEALRIAEVERQRQEEAERAATLAREQAEREDGERNLILERIEAFEDGSPETQRVETGAMVDAYLRTAPDRHRFGVEARWTARQAAWEAAARKEAERLAAARGGILVRTEPAGAAVAVTGVGNERSPATFRELRLGNYEVTVSKPGYEPQVFRLQVEENRITQPEAIVLSPSVGRVEVRSEPSGVEYELHSTRLVGEGLAGVQRSGRTPAVEADLPIGVYTLLQRREGWPEQTLTVEVGRDELAHAAAEFVPGSIRVESSPPGAEVLMDDRVVGVTPLVITDVIPGERILELRLNGHEVQTVMGTVFAREELGLNAVLNKIQFYTVGKSATIPGLNLVMMPIPAGTVSARLRWADSLHLSSPIWLGRTEVTQAQWQAIMGSNPSHFKGANLPVETVSWRDANEFCRKLTERERAADRLPEGYVYSLPTIDQWQYAARAGLGDADPGTWDIRAVGPIGGIPGSRGVTTTPVGTKQADGLGLPNMNALGLHDMNGNVWEWCLDEIGSESRRVFVGRYPFFGGSANWNNREKGVGFRIALVPAP